MNKISNKINTMLDYKKIIINLKNKGFFYIIVGSTLTKAISFVSSIFLPRFLSMADYGLFVYTESIINYLLLLNAFGIANATIKYCSLDIKDSEKKGFFLSTIILGCIFDLIIFVGAFIFFSNMKFQFESAKRLAVLMLCMPILAFILEDMQLFLRATFQNKKFSISSFVYVLCFVSLQILFVIKLNIEGIIFGRYLAYLVSIIITLIFIINLKEIKSKSVWPLKKQISEMIKFGIIMMITNFTSLVLTLNESMLLGNLLKDEALLAEYKVASYILALGLFFSNAIVTFILPYFSKNRNNNKWLKNNFKKAFTINFIGEVLIHVAILFCAKPLVQIVFGSEYADSTKIMYILLIASLFQSIFRAIPGNILAVIGKEKFNFWINIITVVIHFFIDIILIRIFGVYGAALGLIIAYLFSGLLMFVYLTKFLNVIDK